MRRDNERLARELAKTRAALDVVGKAHALLELLSESAEPDTQVEAVIAPAVVELAEHTSTSRACELLGWSGPPTTEPSARPRRAPARAPAGAGERALRGGVGAGAGRAEQRPVRRQVGRAVLGDACWTRAPTCARCRRCTGCCAAPARPANAAARPPTPPGRGPSCSPPHPCTCGPGTSPSSAARRVGSLLRLLRDPRHLLPLRRRLHRRRPRVGRDRRTAHRWCHQPSRHGPGACTPTAAPR